MGNVMSIRKDNPMPAETENGIPVSICTHVKPVEVSGLSTRKPDCRFRSLNFYWHKPCFRQ